MPTPTIVSGCSKKQMTHASRLFTRRPLDMRARVLALRTTGERVIIQARTRDLSFGGAGLTLTSELPSGSSVVLCLRLPGDGGQLCLGAVVARRQGFRVGLEFDRPTAQQRLLLSELCCA
jgi:hypothetical protein